MMTEGRKKAWVLLGLAALAFISLVLMFLLVLQPALNDRERAADQLEEERQLADLLQAELTSAKDDQPDDRQSQDIQQSLPVIRQTDQFISGLHTAEELAGVRIADIYMTYGEPAFEASGNAEDRDDVSANAGAEMELSAGAEVQKQTALVDVYVSRYSGLLRFLNEVESLQRLTNIEMVHISEDSRENEWIFDGNSPIRFEVSISSYYYPALADELEDQAPQSDYAPSGEREQPFLP
ncbi:hypothetical protein BCL52_0696 [Salisediminibacterium halotolerans]|nr:hypothetical protein BCL39_0697 [Actinophytocola xinjiangensis]RPE88435.1 hypothetical protein EDD67_0762 [Salisediminibacterium halotolerans]TWG37203.1 hypothetical protein BCL52_0696 [Salisediminibacterium halotolerans]